MMCVMFFFFFQAEDGIRDYKVTGVQTCALPIWQITYLNSDWLIQFSAQTIRDTRTLPKWRNTFEKLCLWSFVNNQGHYHRRLEVIILLLNDIILDTLHIQITLCLHLTSIWSKLPKICDCQNREKLTHTKMWLLTDNNAKFDAFWYLKVWPTS